MKTTVLSPGGARRVGPAVQTGSGFTQTDLMVLLAAVAVLASLAISWTVRTQRQARLTQCTANLHSVNQAILSFAAEHDQTLPEAVPGQGGEVWWWYKEQVKRHTGLSGPSSPDDRGWACPDDRGYSDPRPFHQTARFDFTSYVFNGVTLPGMPNLAGWRLDAVRKPARTLLVMEWTAHAPLSWHRSRTGQRNLPFYNDAMNVVGFVDGHVRYSPIYYDGFNAAFTRDPILGYDYQYSGL